MEQNNNIKDIGDKMEKDKIEKKEEEKKCECYGCVRFEYDGRTRSPFICRHEGNRRHFCTRKTPTWCPGRAEPVPEEDSVEAKEKVKASAEKLPTKKEVSERLQKACDVINNEASTGIQFVYVKDNPGLNLMFACHNGQTIGKGHRYKPEPKPPKRLLAVLSDNNRVWISKGTLSELNGWLETLPDGIVIDNWYCPSTGEHSEGWQDEWTPDEFRK